MADVTYNTASFPSLIRTLETLLRGPSVHSSSTLSPSTSKPNSHPPTSNSQAPNSSQPNALPPTLAILAYKQRDTSERSLWKAAANVGIRFEKVAEVPGAGGEKIEIWIGGLEVMSGKVAASN